MPEDPGTPVSCSPLAPPGRDPDGADRATPEQSEAARRVIQGICLQRRQRGWRDVYDASGVLAGRLFREWVRAGQPVLYHGRTAGGRVLVLPARLADKQPVTAVIIAEHELQYPAAAGLAGDTGSMTGVDADYGDECVIALSSGRAFRDGSHTSNPEGSTYDRVCDPDGSGSVYRTPDERREAPEEAVGAIPGAAKGGTRAARIPGPAARPRPGAGGKPDYSQWHRSRHDDEPREQERDLRIPGHHYRASIGPDNIHKANAWSWTILKFDGEDNDEVDGGFVDDKPAAEEAVDGWEAAYAATAHVPSHAGPGPVSLPARAAARGHQWTHRSAGNRPGTSLNACATQSGR